VRNRDFSTLLKQAYRFDVYARLKAEIDEAYVAQLLVDAMIRMRMTAYGVGVESPSVAGLKLDLDRLRNEVGEFLREAKKGAEEYIGHIKKMRAEYDKEDEENAE